MEFILQSIQNTSKLLADGPVTVSKAILNYSDNKGELKIKIELNGSETPIATALAALFQVTVLGDKTSGKFKFTSHQTKISDHLSEDDVNEEGLMSKEDIAEGERQGEEFDRENPITEE